MKTSIPCRAPGESGAFTLIELLVVITIIAILAGVAMPAYQSTLMTAHQNAAVQNARQIGLALRACSNDLGGAYPAGTNSYGQEIKTANDAFRGLIPTYLDSEQVFAVPGSKDGPKADNRMDPVTEILKAGENHYAYVSGLSTTSNSNYPLIADGTNDHGKYTNVEGDLGGVWKGTKAVVINVDSSAHLVPLLGTGSDRYIPRFDDPTQDALQVSYIGSAAQLLEPALN